MRRFEDFCISLSLMVMLFLLILSPCSCKAAESEADALRDLSQRMKGVEEKLRSDRHDMGVQIEAGMVESSLEGMIKKAEEQQKQSSQQQKKQDKQKQERQERQEMRSGKSEKPMLDSSPHAPTPPGPTDAAQVSGHSSKWAKLPKAERDAILQSYRDEVPEKWRKRLEAYFTSIAAEETKREKDK